MSRSLGIPVKLLHEAAGHVVTVELKTGEVYRGSMVECEDNWNCQLDNITFTAKDGKVRPMEKASQPIADYNGKFYKVTIDLEVKTAKVE